MEKRSVLLVSSLAVTVMSLLTALRVLPGPDTFGIVLAFLALFIVPGLHIIYIFFGRVPVTTEGLARVFCAGLFFSCFVLLAGAIPGAGYISVSLSASTISAGLAFLSFVRSGRRRPYAPVDLVGRFRDEGEDMTGREKKALVILAGVVLVLCFVLFYGRGETGPATDAPDHISYISRSLETGSLFPADSFFREGDGLGFDPRKGIWHPIAALWAFQADTTAAFLWINLPAVLVFFYLLAFWVFSRELTQSIPLSLMASAFFLVLYRGGGLEWLTRAGYSKNVMQMLFWLSTAYMLRYLREGRSWTLVFIALLSVAGCAVHIVYSYLALFTFLSIGIFTVLGGGEEAWKGRLSRAFLSSAVPMAVPLLLRRIVTGDTFNSIHTHVQGVLLFGDRLSMVDPVEVLANAGTGFFAALLLAPFLLPARGAEGRGKLTAVLFLAPAVTVLNPLTGSLLGSSAGYLYYRLLDACPVSPVLAFGVFFALRALVPGPGAGRGRLSRAGRYVLLRLVPAVAALAVAAYPVRVRYTGFKGELALLAKGEMHAGGVRWTGDLADLVERAGSGAVIASDPVTSYEISAYTDAFVTAIPGQHGNPSDMRALERLEGTRDLFSPYVPLSRSAEWLSRQGVTHVLLDARAGYGRKGFFDILPGPGSAAAKRKLIEGAPLLMPVGSIDGSILFAVDRELLEGYADEGGDTPLLGIPPCGAKDRETGPDGEVTFGSAHFADAGMTLESVELERGVYAPGDTIRGSFCWKLDRPVEFGLPLEWTVRLDTGFPRGSFYRGWYDKQYRRLIERKQGRFFRRTVTGRVMGGGAHPDLWPAGETVRQGFSLSLPGSMAEGRYTFRLSVSRASYLVNRTVSDYLRNDDSLQGVEIGVLTVREGRAE